MERPHALDSGLRFTPTDIGAVYLSGVDQPDGVHSDFDVHLQGLPIYSSYAYGKDSIARRHRHVVHLDSARFHARLPDRDQLIDEAEVIAQVKKTLAQALEKHFNRLKAVLPAETMVGFYPMLRHWKLLAVLNEIQAVPGEVLTRIIDYPVCDTEVYGDFLSRLEKPMSRSELEACEVVSIDDDISSEGAARYQFAWMRDCLVYDGYLAAGHWLHGLIRDLSTEEVTIEPVNETHAATFEGEWVRVRVRFCDAYRIRLRDDWVEITEDACYLGYAQGDAVMMPRGDRSGSALQQVSSYRSEYDDYQTSTQETDREAFSAFVVANTTTDPANALKHLINHFSGCPLLYGKAFVVNIDEKGAVASVRAA